MSTSDKDGGGCPSLTPTFYGVGLYSEWLVRALHNLYNLLFVSQCTFARTHSLGLVCLGRLGFSDLSPPGPHTYIFSYNLLFAQSYCACLFLTFRGIWTGIAHSFQARHRNGSNFVAPYRQNTWGHQRHKCRGCPEELKYKIIEN